MEEKLFLGTTELWNSIRQRLRVLTVYACFCTIFSEPVGRACYHAKICVHNAQEKCGIDTKGKLRRFLDSCDIAEYNCLKITDFVKTNLEKCASLPPIKYDHRIEKIKKIQTITKEKTISKFPSKNIENSELNQYEVISGINDKTIKKDNDNIEIEREEEVTVENKANNEEEEVENAGIIEANDNGDKEDKELLNTDNGNKDE